jgi:UDP-N-acetyl-D-glucosamine dehydrogenase
MSRVAVVGLGYVGLPTALSLADHGARVTGYDVSESRLLDIKSGRVDLSSADHERLERHLHGDGLRLTTEPYSLAEVDAVVVCVPTPVDAHQSPDLRALRGACAEVVKHAVAGQVIVLTSTTYVGCTRDMLVKPLTNKGLRVGDDVFVAFSPERIDPGVADHAPDRTPRVVGGVTTACAERAVAVLAHTAARLHRVSSAEAAEMTKLVENTFRAVNIALANEFSDAADQLSLDVVEVIRAAATKPYGFMPFYPGPGVGGHCIPCDPHYLLWQLRAEQFDAPVTRSAMTAIALRPRVIVAKVQSILAMKGVRPQLAKVLVVGVAYKPNVADVRESPALEIIERLAHAGAAVAYHDPWVDHLDTEHGRLESVANPRAQAWDLVLLHTSHDGVELSWLDEYSVFDATFRGR